jgi:hypothetical protein
MQGLRGTFGDGIGLRGFGGFGGFGDGVKRMVMRYRACMMYTDASKRLYDQAVKIKECIKRVKRLGLATSYSVATTNSLISLYLHRHRMWSDELEELTQMDHRVAGDMRWVRMCAGKGHYWGRIGSWRLRQGSGSTSLVIFY